jgi:hypothetical protein
MCDKNRYPTKAKAKLAIKRHNSKFDEKATYYYWCDKCFSYHITTKPKKYRRIMNDLARNGVI